ncbi:DNA-binding protein [Clostridium botulinum]|nr:DNA-binding protein [Clostridium botulinum]AVQ51191.1 DNA-binding protein [Clostridium botulinum]
MYDNIKVLLKYYRGDDMDRTDFDKLEVQDQVNYINKQLCEGSTLREIASNLNIARSTLRDRFKKIGYIYNKKLNTYSKINNEYDKNNTKVIDKDPIKKQNTLEIGSYKSNTIVSNKESHSIKEFNNLEKELLELINNKDIILEMVKDYKSNTKIIDIPQLNINNLPVEMQKDITTKSIKLYKPIYNLFNKLCEEYSSIKKQDLISLALYEFYIRYKK